MRTNPGKNVTIYEALSLFKEAQMVAMTLRNIMLGFCSTGNRPYNPQIFDKMDFAPAFVINRALFKILGAVLQNLKLFKVNWALNKPAVLFWILVTVAMLQVVLIS